MQNSDLNLARKWRSKNFDQIIGQDLCVRILKNGLYLNSFFPVYLFSGQRGCGKTSTARIFAAALNCELLESFQKNANISIPCLKCISCESMQKGNHPDFIEIDAASHTGIDNVRNIIEASTLLPLIGKKKIYLIDEAHMLSKAAFNAFLKILEEPPASVIFILATTDVQKIIDTVRSRSFQLFFSSIAKDNLISHLKNICHQESIAYDIDGLEIIVKESEGSARDAINLLEQVRFSNHIINKTAVFNSLGHLPDETMLIFFDLLINKKNIKEFLSFLEDINFYKFSAEFIWNKLLDLQRISIRLKHGILIKNIDNNFNIIVNNASLNDIINVMNEFCKNELLFHKSINKNLFLELLCLRLIDSSLSKNHNTNIKKADLNNKEIAEKPNDINKPNNTSMNNDINKWQLFIQEIKKNNDSLIESIFSQAKFISYDSDNNKIDISFAKKFIFFQELIQDNSIIWKSILNKIFGNECSLNIIFDDNNVVIEKKNNINLESKHKVNNITSENINFTDKEKWKVANTLLKYFPGNITQAQKEDI